MGWTTVSDDARATPRIDRIAGAAGALLTCGEVLALLRDDPGFRAFFARTLADAPFDAFFWETPPWTRATLDRAYEHALVDGPALLRTAADPSDFEDRFERAGDADVIAFPNLGGDAMLVVPTPRAQHAIYAHLARFVREAPAPQIDAVLAKLARATHARLSDAPLWVSTAGLGVPWLHLRLDARPKYYRHAPYARP